MGSVIKDTREPDLLTVREAAARLRIRPVTLYRAISRGDLSAYRIGPGHGPLRIPKRALVAYCRPTADAVKAER